jgi:hypothetical protein
VLAIQAARPSRWRDVTLVVLAVALTASLIGVGHGMTGAGGGPAVARLQWLPTSSICCARWAGSVAFSG